MAGEKKKKMKGVGHVFKCPPAGGGTVCQYWRKFKKKVNRKGCQKKRCDRNWEGGG